MKLSEIGEHALKDYNAIKYFPFKNKAGDAFILTADPLSYLEAWLNNKLSVIQRDSQKKRNQLRKAIYFTQLSKDFYNSATKATMPSKATLLYYSFINLVKVCLILNGYDLETRVEHHGLTLPSNYKDKLRLATGNEYISIFREFAKVMGTEINNGAGLEIKLEELLRDLPEIHEIGYALNLFPQTKRKFLPVDVVIRTNAAKNKLYYTISYEKKFDKMMKVDKLKNGKFKKLIFKLDIADDPIKNHYRSIKNFTYTASSDRSWTMCYPKIMEELDKFSITPMLTRQGHRFYLNLEPNRFGRLSSVLAFVFYLGTVARYRPTLNEEILKGKYQPLINEAIIACPNQFFYLLVSHITKQICAIPHSKID